MEGRYRIRAYCTKCGELIMESNPLSKKQLKANWDISIMEAPIACQCKCKSTKINFDIRFMVYDSNKNLEIEPEKVVGKSISMNDMRDAYNEVEAERLIHGDDTLTAGQKYENLLNLRRLCFSKK